MKEDGINIKLVNHRPTFSFNTRVIGGQKEGNMGLSVNERLATGLKEWFMDLGFSKMQHEYHFGEKIQNF